MNNKYLDAFNLTEADIAELKYPILIWSDIDNKNEIVLLADKNTERIVCKQEGEPVQKLLGKTTTNFDDFINEAKLGDEAQHVFKLVEFENGIINWDSLIKDYSIKVDKLPYKEGDFATEVVVELNNNYIQDVKASLMECIYNSIIFNIHTLATELIIESIGFLGELSYQERFRQIIHKNLNEDFTVILGN